MKKALTNFPLLALCLAAAFLPPASAQQEAPLKIKNWVTTRMRMTTDAFNVLQADFKLSNSGDAELSDLSIIISYQKVEGDELKVTEAIAIPKLAAGETHDVSIKTGDAPSFDCYEIRLTYHTPSGEQKAHWLGRGDQGQPFLIPEKLLGGEPQLTLVGSAFWFDKPNMPLQGVLRVRNLSATPVEQLMAKVYFTDGQQKNPRTLGTWSGRVDNGLLGAGEEKMVKLGIPLSVAPKSFSGHRIEFTYVAKETPPEFAPWCGGEFTHDANVEACHWDFRRAQGETDGLAISARVRNGLPQAVDSVTLQITFLKKDGDQKRVVREVRLLLFQEMPAGGTQDAEAVLKNFKTPFDEIERKVLYRIKTAPPQN